ncbi:MAG TPA: trimethylamine methyltransferase family protein, partial [Candidatus Limnocylindrales bacterium]|nr:trimethylamine methyltransferase family protein [Candidatus Limnocylindrales bacterium]
MTEPGIEGGETPRRRSGGRAGHERHVLPQQRPSAQSRIRIRPTEIVSADELESIHLASLRVLREIGMDFLDDGARELLRAAGATVDPASQRVRFDPDFVTERIKTAP